MAATIYVLLLHVYLVLLSNLFFSLKEYAPENLVALFIY